MLKNYTFKCLPVLIICMLVVSVSALAQDTTKYVLAPGQLSGKVVNLFNVPIQNAKVKVVGTTETASTNREGKFVIRATLGTKLLVKADGFNTVEYKIKPDKRGVIIQLGEQFLKHPEHLDVLYDTIKASENLSAISTIYTNQLTSTPASLYTFALPGQLSGLYVKQQSGFASPYTNSPTSQGLGFNFVSTNGVATNDDNNGQFSIQARGASQPITVIDGVQRELSSIDPESIESVSLLKDGLATILLGVNSSNNVLLITTKKPQVGKTLISATAQYALQQPLGLPQPLSAFQYAYLSNEALQNDGKGPVYSSADLEAYRNHTDPYGHPDVNWFNTILRKTSPMTNYKVNVSGGNGVAKFVVSLSYLNQSGMFKNDKSLSYNTDNSLNRYMLNSDINITANKNFVLDLQLFGRVQNIIYPGGAGGYLNLLSALYSTPNNAYPVYNANGSFGGNKLYTNNLLAQSEYSGYTNLLSHDILTNLDLKYNLGDFLTGLSFRAKGNFSINSQNFIDRGLTNTVFQINPVDNSYVVYGSAKPQNNSFSNISSSRFAYGQAALAYNNVFGRNKIDASLFYDYRSVVLTYDLPRLYQNRAANVAYNYDGKYFITGVVNNSSDDRYPPGHRAHFFYAGGIGWQMAKENFMKDLTWINSWKWRATYGNTGNDNVPGYFGYRAVYQSTAYAYPQGTGYGRGDGYGEVNGIVNPNVNPERADKINVGTDIAFFDNKFLLTADYYNNRYYDLLVYRGSSSAVAGAQIASENLGIHRYTGGELSLTYQGHAHDFNYFITGNGNITADKWIYLDEIPTFPGYTITGHSSRVIRGYIADGLFQTQQQASSSPTINGYSPKAGDIKYKDLNGDGIIDQNDVAIIGNVHPLIYYGLNLGFNYKGFNFMVLFQGVGNNQTIFNPGNLTQGFIGQNFGGAPYGQAYNAILNRWTPENANTATSPRLSYGSNNNNGLGSTYYLRSANFVRLKNAEIGYTLPFRLVNRIKLSSLKLFINGENLFTIAGYKGIDPEVNMSNNNFYPIQRIFNAGMSVKL